MAEMFKVFLGHEKKEIVELLSVRFVPLYGVNR